MPCAITRLDWRPEGMRPALSGGHRQRIARPSMRARGTGPELLESIESCPNLQSRSIQQRPCKVMLLECEASRSKARLDHKPRRQATLMQANSALQAHVQLVASRPWIGLTLFAASHLQCRRSSQDTPGQAGKGICTFDSSSSWWSKRREEM